MIRQHTALPHRQRKLRPAASTSGHSLADLSASPSLAKSTLRRNHHSAAATTQITRRRIASTRRRFTAPPFAAFGAMPGSPSSSTAGPAIRPATEAAAPPASVVHRAMAWIGPDFGLVAAFTAVLGVLIAAYGGSFKWT